MKKEKQAHCPGCGKHCPMNSVRCKYGRNYFAKLEAKRKKAEMVCGTQAEPEKRRRKKWEKHVCGGGPLWQLLHTAGGVKKALRSGGASEDELLKALDAPEREQLRSLLVKIGQN